MKVFIALLRTCQLENKLLVKQALDILMPALPQRLPPGDNRVPIWIRYTKKILVEEGHSIPNMIHIFQLIVRHSDDLFYSCRAQFVPQMVNSLSRLGLPYNTTIENRRLAIELAGLVVAWEKQRQTEVKDVPDSEGHNQINNVFNLSSVGGEMKRTSDASAFTYLSKRVKHFSSIASPNKNKQLVEQLKYYGIIRSKKVAKAMKAIDRGIFVPPGNPAFIDSPIPIGYYATISAPHMHAACLQLLEDHLQPGMRALDVGSGTGYLTVCFAMMVRSQGRVVGVEHIPELVASSIEKIKRSAAAPLLEEGSLSVHVADGRLGWPELAPYDAIHVGAAAPEIPQALIEQLKPGGRLVIPVGTIFQKLQVIDKKMDDSVIVRNEASVHYVPLTSREAQLGS